MTMTPENKGKELRVERTVSYQVETPEGCYVATTYSEHDAKLVADLAKDLPDLKCLPSSAPDSEQPKGIYISITREGETYPGVEVYDARLAERVKENADKLVGETEHG